MKGFDPKFRDLPDFIIGITKEIWEDRGIATGRKPTDRILADCHAINHHTGRDDPIMPPRSAIRWSLHGKHSGWGAFGAPSGAEVYVLGISHAEHGPWGLRREFTLIDETAIWKQILLHRGAL